MLSICNLSKSFGTKKVLSDLNLTVNRGEIALLLGASGSGKSTLLRILNNLEQPDSGTLVLDGQQLQPNEIIGKHLVGMVFQQFNLFDYMTVKQNITFPLEKGLGFAASKASDQADALLIKYGLIDKADSYPTELSGGQKQRLALARSLALKPHIICLDEPTSALDPLLTNYVAQTIEELAQEGYIVLVASHDTKLIEQLTCTIYLMQDGKIIEQGLSSDIKQYPQKYPAIYRFIKGI